MKYNEFKSFVQTILREQETILIVAGLANDFKNNKKILGKAMEQCRTVEPGKKRSCVMVARLNELKGELLLYKRATNSCNNYGEPIKVQVCQDKIRIKFKMLEDKIKGMTVQIPKTP